MTLYIGDKPVGLYKVVEKKVPKVKYGVSIDNLLGDVDENGGYIKPTGAIMADFSGVKEIPDSGFKGLFAYMSSGGTVFMNDVKKIGNSAFDSLCLNSSNIVVYFDGLEEVSAENAFSNAFKQFSCVAYFKNLKKVSGNNAFNSAWSSNSNKFAFDVFMPSLEDVSGSTSFYSLPATNYYASQIKKITGATSYSAYGGVFQVGYLSTMIHFSFPRATEISNCIVGASGSGAALHFAAQNQTAIEACEGYDKMFGAKEIYFDLMLTIVINGITYSRHQTIDGYTSWADESGNIVYTDATSEPAVGTVVYSDAGTTQVGTVTEVA